MHADGERKRERGEGTRERERRESKRETECKRERAHAREGEMLACCRRSRNLLVRLIAGVVTVVHVPTLMNRLSASQRPTGENATLGEEVRFSKCPANLKICRFARGR